MTEQTMGQRIAECRKKLGISQEALGEKLGVSRQAISKWESDSAVPEIDKLIAMSRLFQVSVGWLLGVEEQPRTQDGREPQISEELLRKIEEIVLRYRPRKEKLSVKKKWIIGIAAVLILWLCHSLLSQWDAQSSMLSFTYAQVDAINEQNTRIQRQLNELTDQLQHITTSVEEAAAVASFDFTILPDLKDSSAQVQVSIIPKLWNESYSARLSVRMAGRETVSQQLHWDGTALIGKVQLDMADGYEYWLVVEYPDGLREQVRLEHELGESLQSSHSIRLGITMDPNRDYWSQGALDLAGYSLNLARPEFPGQDENWYWDQAEFFLVRTHNAQDTETGSFSILSADVQWSEGRILDPSTIELWGASMGEMDMPDLAEGDALTLWFRAGLRNGITLTQQLDSWVWSNGLLRRAEPET